MIGLKIYKHLDYLAIYTVRVRFSFFVFSFFLNFVLCLSYTLFVCVCVCRREKVGIYILIDQRKYIRKNKEMDIN